MSIRRHFPSTKDDLCRILAQYVHRDDTVVMQAGHFLLYFDHTEAVVLPGIAEELHSPRHAPIADEIGRFPRLTWELGLSLLAGLNVGRRYAMVVANDWQYLPDVSKRFDFYRRAPRLTESYTALLDQFRDKIELLVPGTGRGRDTGDYFSEQSLRKAYGRHVKELIAQGNLPSHARIDRGRELTCSLEDSIGERREIYCSGKRQNCTHEVAELIWTVHDLSRAQVFVNLFPLVCREYMIEGSELSHELFRHGVRTVVNVGMTSSHVQDISDLIHGAEVIAHQFEAGAVCDER
jgi:hypothetical protein